MSTQSFKVKSGLTLNPTDLTTLTSPQAGDLACDSNDSNKIKRYDAASASWTEVGSGASGDVDTLLVQDFDSASLSSFTQTGLALITTNPLDGRQSARLIHQPLVGAIQSFKQIIDVSPKFRGVNMTASLLLRSSASQGNVTIQFRDETNSVDYPSQQLQTNSQEIASLVTNSTTLVSGFSNSVINSLKVGMSVTGSGIPTGTTIDSINSSALTIVLSQAATASATVSLRFSDLPRTIQLGFQIPANCSSYSYTISALQEAGLPETYVDDIVLKNYWLGMSNQGQSSTEIEVPVVTEWTDFTPVWSSAGTQPSIGNGTITGKYRRVGDSVEIFTEVYSGSTTTYGTGAYSFSMPAGLIIDSNKIATSGDRTVLGVAALFGTRPYNADVTHNGALSQQVSASLHTSATIGARISNTFPETWTNVGNINSFSLSYKYPVLGWALTETQSFITNDLVPAKAVLGNTSLEIPSITGWQGYTPTFQGFGSPSNIEFEWRQVGENVEIRGKFVSGVSTAVEARVGLPAGLTSAGTSLIPSLQLVGTAGRNDASVSNSVLIEPSVTYLTMGQHSDGARFALIKQNANIIAANGTTMSFFASVPCAGLSATEEVVVSGTQSALVQEADSTLRMHTASKSGNVLLFSTIAESIGSDVSYSSGSYTIQTSGVYSIGAVITMASVDNRIHITKNSTATNSIDASVLSWGATQNTGGYEACAFWTGTLVAGDVIRFTTINTLAVTDSNQKMFITKQGSLKQLNVSSDQKITIPTSELRFTGSSSRGTADSGTRVKFDTLASIRGDAFTVTNDATGTMLTVTKKGILSVNANLVTASATYAQIIVAGRPMSAFDISGNGGSGSWDGTVNIGDTIYVVAGLNPNGNLAISFNAILQEQDIAVSVTNTLPQFSESDSSVRVDTANGYGSTGTLTRRFSNVRDNIGTDIEYADSATNGASFTVRSAGIYNISYSDMFDSASNAYMGITKNASSLSTAVFSLAASERLALTYMDIAGANASCSWQGYLAVGDIIRAQVGAANATANPSRSTFTISKVGKPNVTGVDVTPFVNVPQPKTQSSLHVAGAITANSIVTSLTSFSAVDSGVYSVNTTTGIYTVLKPANFTISYSSSASGAASVTGVVVINSIDVAVDTTAPAANNFQNAVWTGLLNAGDTFWARSANNASSNQKIIVSATALSDQILTAPETFSTDTASLQYASSSLYNLTTLANAPVGTYITFTYAPNTNTRTQTTTPPSQSPADMNANGIQIFTRAYNAASTSGNPSAIAIQIGKGHKGFKIGAYTNTVGKITPANLDFYTSGANTEVGALIKDYSETTGILIIDAGYRSSVSNTTHVFIGSDQTNPNPIRLDVNASKNPALTGMNLERVSARAFNSAGTSIPSASNTTITYSGTTFDTHGAFNTSTGVFTAPETGYYQINGAIGFANFSWTASQIFDIYFLKNGITFATKRQVMPTISESSGTNLSDVVYLLKSDTVTMQVRHTRGTATTLEAGGTYNYLSIAKVNIGKGN
jgi:hypothetical protein